MTARPRLPRFATRSRRCAPRVPIGVRCGSYTGVGRTADDALGAARDERGYGACGRRNIFADLAPIAPQVSVEAVIAADPEAVITAEPDARASDALAMWHQFPSMAATRRGQFYTLDADP